MNHLQSSADLLQLPCEILLEFMICESPCVIYISRVNFNARKTRWISKENTSLRVNDGLKWCFTSKNVVFYSVTFKSLCILTDKDWLLLLIHIFFILNKTDLENVKKKQYVHKIKFLLQSTSLNWQCLPWSCI